MVDDTVESPLLEQDAVKESRNRNLSVFGNALKNHLGELHNESHPWALTYEEPYGRGVVASRDIQENELIFYDKPLLIGPRVNNYEKIFCIICYKILTKLTLCPGKCKFPICSDCTDSKVHQDECNLIKSWELKNERKYSKHLFRALTVIRGLLLSEDDKRLMHMMECHENCTIQNLEVEKVLEEFEKLTSDCETVNELKRISSVLNTNAFEVGISFDMQPENVISLRGLYPMAAILNHCCIPNIRYAYQANKVMAIRASKFIAKGEQIFNSYTKFLWSTQQRRVHLAYSKKFFCECSRCLDPTEFGSYISALKCVSPVCDGLMLPIIPTNIQSSWECTKCKAKLNHLKISKLNDIFSKQVFGMILKDSMSNLNNYLKVKLSKLLPDTNQFTIELKLQIILKMKQEKDYTMTLTDYEDITKYCQDVLDTLDKLTAGECFVRGLLYHEMVTAKLMIYELTNQDMNKEIKLKLTKDLNNCWSILGDTISEPKDLRMLLQKFK